ncbi:hypothetical protein PR001_g26603 [Phytophthora rubi]|uniref:BZIP domain-containing protein n=1 Tax=Phytophthora rubi TaxID=129364 RepID=A0A6A3HAE7_9STRA|nr:hypothetical protein PR002_g28449 [Phytophthora rubi]KAE8972460.1 hypothetical protein PR001_g26603 [Phytophthora rubi]
MQTPLLEPEADDLATVAEALAFIDAYEGSTSESGSDSVQSPHPNSSSGVDVLNSVDEQPKPKHKRRSKNPAGYSTRLLHRKKAEMQRLREESLQLEAKVAQLRHTRAVGVGALAAHASQLKRKAEFKWMELAMAEFQRRQRSEYMNRRLTALLANQAKVDDALRGVVMKRSVLEGIDFVFEKPLTAQSSLHSVDNSSVIMAQLEIKAAEMYLGSRGLFEGESKFCTISCKMRRKADAHHGEMVEIVSCAPLSCPMEIASSSLWRELTTLRTFPDKTYRYMQASSPNVMEKCFDQILRSNAAATPLNGLQVMKKFEEADRVVLVRASRMLPATDGLHLRSDAWTIFTRSEADPTEACEVRTFVQLYMERQPGLSASPKDIAYLRKVAFETWSLKMRWHAQYLQEMMIEAAAGDQAGTSQQLLKNAC